MNDDEKARKRADAERQWEEAKKDIPRHDAEFQKKQQEKEQGQ